MYYAMKYLLLLSVFIYIPFSYSQEGLEFSVNQQFYLKGNSALIGNNIISTDATKPHNDNDEINDVLKLEYIDVDNDTSTFSSSEANLQLECEGKQIKYAALYWSAIYKYDKGVKRVINNEKIVYRGNNERSENINNVLLKLPESEYQPIEGSIIFDSFSTTFFEHNKPYLCYADVTSLFQNSKYINGTYTLANIKATEGYIAGGASGGWLLYVIYEDDTVKPKYFTTYNGFIEVDRSTVDIRFKDFKTDEIGEIKTSICLGVLEGDQKYKTDNCSILTSNNQTYKPLSNPIRPVNNFFNGTITTYDQLYLDRNPNSTNTLGFDVLKMEIPNANNSVISNNSTESTIRLQTKADGFYLFFVAFETEISPIYLEGKNNTETILVLNNNEDQIEEEPKEIKTKDIKETTIEKEIKQPKVVTNKKLTPVEKIERLKSIAIPNLNKGYYLVTNVFSVEENATKWMATLKEKGHEPYSYINPKNGWHYIYLNHNEDANVVYLKRKELAKLDYFKDIWILKINF